MEELTITARSGTPPVGAETEYEYAKAFVQLLYKDYDWQFGAWACLEGTDANGVRRAKDSIKKSAPKLIKEYFMAKRDPAGLDEYLSAPPARRLDGAFALMADALLAARQDFGRVVEVQFALTDRFLYACWLLAGTATSAAVFEKILPHAFTFPKVDFETQYAACCKSAKKAHDAYVRDKENVRGSLESVYVHFGYVSDLIAMWIKKSGERQTRVERRLAGLLYEWNAVHYIMPLYVAVNGYRDGDGQFRRIAKELFDYSTDGGLTSMAMRALLDSAKKLHELNSRKLDALYARIAPRCEALLSAARIARRELS